MVDYYSVLGRLGRKGYQAELVVRDSSELTFEVNESMAIVPMESTSTSYEIRVIDGHRPGIASSSSFNSSLVEMALRMAEVSEKDRNETLPSKKSAGTSKTNLKFRLRDDIDRIKQTLLDLMDVPKSDMAGAVVQASNFRKKVISTEGTDVEERRSSLYVELGLHTHNAAGVPAPDVWEDYSSTALNANVQGMKDSLAGKQEALKTRVKNARQYDEVALTSRAACLLLGTLVEPAFLGESLYRRSTPMRMGRDIGNPNVSIADNPSVEYSTGNRVFDIEGQRRMPVHLMRGGKVEGFLYDTYWAHKTGKVSTASAGGSCNLVIGAGEEKDVTQDVLVVDDLQGVHGSDPNSGKFSVNAGVAWRNMNGRTEGARDVIISGDLVTLLRGIESMSSKRRIDEGIVVGDLRIKGLSVG